MKKAVLMLFNRTLGAPLPFLRRGYTVISCDTQHPERLRLSCEHGGLLIETNLGAGTQALEDLLRWTPLGLVLSFAPCTDMAVSGAAHFKKKLEANPRVHEEALGLALLGTTYGCPYAIENPVSILSTLWRKPDYVFHPYEFAAYCPTGPHPLYPDVLPEQDRYRKKTCLWTSPEVTLPPRMPLEPLEKEFPGHTKLGGSSLRTKNIRSSTPRGFAEAFCLSNEHLLTPKAP